ncbi:MAG: sodium:proline symporter, partial [Ignavibacteriales bacterium]|nr:sodium:proline symporter [Ignavibacteriales bacterium]
WSSWYPGADPGGGGYIAQRMMSAKNESHSLFATLWFTIAHYCLRPWPWIIVALGALILLPRLSTEQITDQKVITEYQEAFVLYNDAKSEDLEFNQVTSDPKLLEQLERFNDKQFYEAYENTVDPGKMYPKLMVMYLPAGILGLMIAVFLAAYMSTISSQLNWGTSYIINDFYRRFIKKNASEKHYVLVSRLSIILMMIFALLITKYVLTTISGAWEFIINASAGLGAVLILRWYWWRVNAWSEISAMIAPLIIYPIAHYGFGLNSPITLYPTVIGTTLVWLVVTFLTKPDTKETLQKFYKKVHPGGRGWIKIAKENPEVKADSGYGKLFVNWICGVILVYAFLFATGKIIFKDYLIGFVALSVGVIASLVIYFNIRKNK